MLSCVPHGFMLMAHVVAIFHLWLAGVSQKHLKLELVSPTSMTTIFFNRTCFEHAGLRVWHLLEVHWCEAPICLGVDKDETQNHITRLG